MFFSHLHVYIGHFVGASHLWPPFRFICLMECAGGANLISNASQISLATQMIMAVAAAIFPPASVMSFFLLSFFSFFIST